MKTSQELAQELARRAVREQQRVFTIPRAGQKMSNLELAERELQESIPLTELIAAARVAEKLKKAQAMPELLDALTNLRKKMPELFE